MAPIVPRWGLLACQEIRRNKSEENLSIAARYSTTQHDIAHRSTMSSSYCDALLRPITKTINRASNSLLKSFINCRTLSTIRRGSEELYWA
ncbi:hypothetical protein P8452_22161 [Trifolium repens]|nr:hypothetical protein P8452_22161 [Trifolium repens]